MREQIPSTGEIEARRVMQGMKDARAADPVAATVERQLTAQRLARAQQPASAWVEFIAQKLVGITNRKTATAARFPLDAALTYLRPLDAALTDEQRALCVAALQRYGVPAGADFGDCRHLPPESWFLKPAKQKATTSASAQANRLCDQLAREQRDALLAEGRELTTEEAEWVASVARALVGVEA